MAALAKIRSDKLRQALEATFSLRGTHPIPKQLPNPPRNWEVPFKKLADEVSADYAALDDAFLALQRFLDPLLANYPVEVWDPANWSWR